MELILVNDIGGRIPCIEWTEAWWMEL